MFRDLRGGITRPQFLTGYFLFLAGSIGLAFGLAAATGADVVRALLAICAGFIAVAAVGRPRIVYLLARNIGGARSIRSDRVLRGLFAAYAVVLIALANWFPRGSIPFPRMASEAAPAAPMPGDSIANPASRPAG